MTQDDFTAFKERYIPNGLDAAMVLGGIIQGIGVGAVSAWLCGASFMGGLAAAMACTFVAQAASIFFVRWFLVR